MMNGHIRRILNLGFLMEDLVVCATGCLALVRGFRMAAIEKNESAMAASVPAAGTPRKAFAGIGAALFFLAFDASEAAATIVALRR